MLNKAIIIQSIKDELAAKTSSLQNSFDDANAALSSETKSSAGDKHETGRAMAQLEQEKLSGQLQNFSQLKAGVERINAGEEYETIQFGSLVKTSIGLFFISVGIGEIRVKETDIFCLSITTPIGKQIAGKKAGDVILFNGKKIEVLEVS